LNSVTLFRIAFGIVWLVDGAMTLAPTIGCHKAGSKC
jgi:hypothetical protein